jgi:group I intron endonuclease
MTTAVIYRIRNDIDGKEYYGVTTNPEKRKSDHLVKKRGSVLISKAVDEHGLSNFTFEIILYGTEEYCYKLEETLIRSFKSRVPLGYNIAPGGAKPPNATGRKHSEKTKAKMAANHNPASNGPLSEITKLRISKAHTGMKRPPRTHRQIELNRSKTTGQRRPGSNPHNASWIEQHSKSMVGVLVGRKQPKSICPHCTKVGGSGTMKRWHFDNCKEKK